MSRWFRFYDEAINDPKLLRLSDANFRAWVTLLCLASKHDGALPSVADIALVLRVKQTKVAEWLAALVAAGLLDNNAGQFSPHNWNDRQYKSDSSAERMKRHRDKKRDVTGDVTVTVQNRTEADTDNRTEKKDRAAAARSDDWPSDFGDQFWEAYPRKTEKLAAMKKLAVVRKSGIVTFADLMAGARRYAASKPDPQFTKHPTTWLNAGCWSDETQHGATNGQRNLNETRRSASDNLLAGFARVAANITGDDQPSWDAGEEIPSGRVNIDG